MELKNQAILILALTALVLVFYFRMASFSPTTIVDRDGSLEQRDVIQTIAQNTTSRHFDKSGKLNYSFFAKEVVHLSPNNNESTALDESYTRLSAPIIAFYEPTQNWQVSAQEGNVSGETQAIFLRGNVTLERLANSNDSETPIVKPEHEEPKTTVTARLLTDTLLMQPHLKVAHTDSAVTITDGLSSLSAVGMTLDIEKQQLKLHAKVRGTHAPF